MRRKYIWVTDLKWSLRAVRMQIWNRLRLDDGCPALPTQADFTLPTTSVQKNWGRKKLLEIWDMLFRESENCCWRLRNRVMQIGTGQDWTSVVLLPKLISLCWAPHLFEPEPLQQILAQWHTAADLFAGFYITLCSPKTQYKPPDVLQYIWTYVGYEFKMLGLTFSVLCSCDPTDLADTFHFASLTTWPETLDTTIGMHNMGERPSTDSHKWT